MGILTDSMIYNDFKNLILYKYIVSSVMVYIVMAFVFITICSIIISILLIVKRKRYEFKRTKKISNIISITFIATIAVTSLIIAGISWGIGNYNINYGNNKIEYTVSIETLEEKYCYQRTKGFFDTPYYLVFNDYKFKDSVKEEASKYQINVKRKFFHDVSIGDKMYVVRDNDGYIVLVYSCKDYKYLNDNND